MDIFATSHVAHATGKPNPGAAAESVLTSQAFAQAAEEITAWAGYEATPLHGLDALARELGLGRVDYKDEGPRFGLGSFKALGGAYAGLRILQRQLEALHGRPVAAAEIRNGSLASDTAGITLASATDGNHGRSLAWGASNFGARCRIYIHRDVSAGRAESIAGLGAEVIRIDGDYDDSVRAAREESEANGWFVVSDTSWEGYVQPPLDVMSGYGVMVDEIATQLEAAPTHVFLQGGVGGLAAAVTARLRQIYGAGFRVVVVEPELADCLFVSARNGRATTVALEEETLMAGLSCGEPSMLAWEVLDAEVHDFLTIPDALVGPSMRLLGRPLGDDPSVVAGESAVCGLAGLIAACRQPDLKEKLALSPEARVLLIGSEGATDPEIYDRLVGAAA